MTTTETLRSWAELQGESRGGSGAGKMTAAKQVAVK